MNYIKTKTFDLGYMDKLAAGDSRLHRLDPRVKVITTLAFITTVVSFGKYSIAALTPFFLFPVVSISAGGLPAGYLLRKTVFVLPFAVLIGIFNPLIDTETLLRIGSINISGGWVSLFSLILKSLLTVSSAAILLASTGFNAICESLVRMKVPRPFANQLLFLYRYMFILIDEAGRMVRALALRSSDSKAPRIKIFAPLAGHLLLRTLDRSERIYLAMLCRGFDGHIRMLRQLKIRPADIAYGVLWAAAFFFFRYVNVPLKLGELMTGAFR